MTLHSCQRCDEATAAAHRFCPRCRSIRATNRVILTVVAVLVAMAIVSVIGTFVLGTDLTGG
ncbi:hypothetical protein [Azospirillum sp. sgz302134]